MEPLWRYVLDSKVVKSIERAIKGVDLDKLTSLFGSWGNEGKGAGLVAVKDAYRPTTEESSRHMNAMAQFNEHATPEQLKAWWEDMKAWAEQKREQEAEQHRQSLSNQKHGNWQGWLKSGVALVGAAALLVKAFKGR